MTMPDPKQVEEPALLPCPFCGGEANVNGPIGGTFSIYQQHSLDCPVGGFERNYETEAEAIAAWNTRLAHDEPRVGVGEALKLAKRHIEHMAAWIGKQQARAITPYSFESLGEDMPTIDAALNPDGEGGERL